MTTATPARDQATELGRTIGQDDIGPAIALGDPTALVSCRHPHQIITDIWIRREAGWRAVKRIP
jgi:hypothetical protein